MTCGNTEGTTGRCGQSSSLFAKAPYTTQIRCQQCDDTTSRPICFHTSSSARYETWLISGWHLPGSVSLTDVQHDWHWNALIASTMTPRCRI